MTTAASVHIVVASTSDGVVKKVWYTPPEYGKDPALLGRTVAHHMEQAIDEFPYPAFDVTTGRLDDSEELTTGLQRLFPEHYGFDDAEYSVAAFVG